ncbi:hypothetical protein SAMD00019534_057650 [Acytostelium subglobosum LB1]|uniref:hypothetical protein n=1 Tax=Acytostelium subglobosum LB1 TaxID=1410327 RepID=UPI000644A53F|nr:hypothetical protein SAMD00019534_057650 [Acytostelium subglobosum LB1]GAM22590.1 hypothetical protein SAMD00019534_057650 [Acytostelium subglobosum LB1]|eukprot:XP_012754710.1 hypothetical protein SAMD00019534_057650 [Acytostelium subglobosum LB1]
MLDEAASSFEESPAKLLKRDSAVVAKHVVGHVGVVVTGTECWIAILDVVG